MAMVWHRVVAEGPYLAYDDWQLLASLEPGEALRRTVVSFWLQVNSDKLIDLEYWTGQGVACSIESMQGPPPRYPANPARDNLDGHDLLWLSYAGWTTQSYGTYGYLRWPHLVLVRLGAANRHTPNRVPRPLPDAKPSPRRSTASRHVQCAAWKRARHILLTLSI